jgi:predicted membrane protein
LFASSLVGYFFGRDLLNSSHITSLILAIAFAYFGILIETGLYIIKTNKQEKLVHKS